MTCRQDQPIWIWWTHPQSCHPSCLFFTGWPFPSSLSSSLPPTAVATLEWTVVMLSTFDTVNGVCVSLCDGSFLPLWATSACLGLRRCRRLIVFLFGNIVIGSHAFECECRLTGRSWWCRYESRFSWLTTEYWLEKNLTTRLLHLWKNHQHLDGIIRVHGVQIIPLFFIN